MIFLNSEHFEMKLSNGCNIDICYNRYAYMSVSRPWDGSKSVKYWLIIKQSCILR